jgi:trk system potassium uptake protein TrkA
MGKRVAHLVRGSMQDYLEIGDDFALVKTKPGAAFVGTPLGQLGIRSTYGVTVTAVKRPDERWTYTTADTVLGAQDVILVAGETRKAEAFSQLR